MWRCPWASQLKMWEHHSGACAAPVVKLQQVKGRRGREFFKIIMNVEDSLTMPLQNFSCRNPSQHRVSHLACLFVLWNSAHGLWCSRLIPGSWITWQAWSVGFRELNLGWPHASHVPYPLYYPRSVKSGNHPSLYPAWERFWEAAGTMLGQCWGRFWFLKLTSHEIQTAGSVITILGKDKSEEVNQ